MGKQRGILAISRVEIGIAQKKTESSKKALGRKVKVGEVTKEELKRIHEMTKEIKDGKMEIKESFNMAGSHG